MCALVGVAGDLFAADVKVMNHLLFVGQLRGMDSTGVAGIKQKGSAVLKKTLPALEFLSSKHVDKVLNPNCRAMIGHCRAATIGDVTHENAHPFMFDSQFVGAHNGTITSLSKLDNYKDYETDSEALLWNIYQKGPEKVLPQLYGAYALSWYDFRNKTLNFIRNYDRTLYHCYSVDYKALFWASEACMLEFALSRSEIKHTEIEMFKTDQWYKFDIAGSYNKWIPDRHLEVKEIKRPPVTKIWPASGANHSHPTCEYGGGWFDDLATDLTPAAGPVTDIDPLEDTEIISGLPVPYTPATGSGMKEIGTPPTKEPTVYYKGYQGRKLDQREFEAATKNGCDWCGESIQWGDTVRFGAEGIVLCRDCMKSKDLVQGS